MDWPSWPGPCPAGNTGAFGPISTGWPIWISRPATTPRNGAGVTVVGVYDGDQVEQYVADHNMWLINDALKPYNVVCTFAGNTFDLPVLKRVFPNMYLPPVSIDLRWCLKRLDHTGGLKRIEKRLGLNRPDEVADMDGLMAVRLWAAYQNGDAQALNTLLTYNAYDVINLKPLLEYSAERLRRLVLGRLPAKNV